MALKIIFGVIAVAIVIIMIYAIAKSGHWLRSMLMIPLSGFAALFAVNLLGTAIDITIPLNWLTL
ncbi:MAG: pro-sigmaK processing inhibitor BofA family protein, partial [Oscillospiraceae bacterium]|nr:pro-sigmaK processing inhibitor BofA family protein [Oscillospiraceae bacterium]